MFKKYIIYFISLTSLISSCATSMSPSEVNSTLPTITKSKFIPKTQAEEIIESNKCRYLVKNRNYVAPIGLSVKNDLKYGAKGIDEWVKIDGGNAYVLINYKWVNVGDDGVTQLHLDFDTLICN